MLQVSRVPFVIRSFVGPRSRFPASCDVAACYTDCMISTRLLRPVTDVIYSIGQDTQSQDADETPLNLKKKTHVRN
jgi:hypothetical protein